MEETKEAERAAHAAIPLEYKYRVQLDLPARVLNHKAKHLKQSSRELVHQCQVSSKQNIT